MAEPNFFEFLAKRRSTQSPDDAYQLDQQQPRTVATKHYELPKIDSENVIGSLSGMLGPSPEERAEEEKRLQEHRRKMHGWTALFNGLRHLGNLYYAAKGAPGQKFSDPHQQIEQQYQDERRRLADIHAADQKYYGTLYNIRRQMESDRIANENHQSTLEWRKAQEEERQRQFEEKQRQFEARQQQQQQQFEARQQQQQQQFEERQKQQQAQFNRRQQRQQNGGAKKAGSGNGKGGGGLGWGKKGNQNQETDW